MDDPTFIALNKMTTRPYRNAEIVTVPDNVVKVARASEHFKCSPYNLLVEFDLSHGREWVDASREVVATYRGEVILASHYSIATAFALPLLAERGAMSGRALEPNGRPPVAAFPAVLLDARAWRRMPERKLRPKRRRQRSSGDEDNDDEDFRGAAVEFEIDSDAERQDAEQRKAQGLSSDDDDESAALDIRVFVSPHPKNVGFRSVQPKQRCLIVRPEPESAHVPSDEDDEVDAVVRAKIAGGVAGGVAAETPGVVASETVTETQQPAAESGGDDSAAVVAVVPAAAVAAAAPAKAKPVGKKAAAERHLARVKESLRAMAYAQRLPDDLFLAEYKQQVTTQEPFHGAQAVFAGSVMWGRLAEHVYSTTVVPSSAKTGSNNTRDDEDGRSRAVPRRQLLALCCFGMPDEAVMSAVFARVVGDAAASAAAGGAEAMSVVLFLDMPTLHFDPVALVASVRRHSTFYPAVAAASAAPAARRAKGATSTAAATPTAGATTANTVAAPQRSRRAQAKLARVHALLTRALDSAAASAAAGGGASLSSLEVDVVVNAASRYVGSPLRMPSAQLMQLYVKEMRGGVEPLDSASSVVCVNHADRLVPLLAEMFAQRTGIPFVRIEHFLGMDAFAALPQRAADGGAAAFDDDDSAVDDSDGGDDVNNDDDNDTDDDDEPGGERRRVRFKAASEGRDNAAADDDDDPFGFGGGFLDDDD